MKKTILIIATFMVALLPVFAQNISENKTLRKDRVWYFDCASYNWGDLTWFGEIKVRYDRDSVADDKNYLIFLIEDCDQQIPLLLREENGKIYRRFEEVRSYSDGLKSNQEYLLYDFSENGETNYETGLDCRQLFLSDVTWLGSVEILNRELIDVKGEQLVQLSAKSKLGSLQPCEFKIVEGIGARERGLLGYLLMGDFAPNGTGYDIGFNRLEDAEGNLIFNAADIGFAGVETAEADRREADGRMFDLMGREIRNPQPGTLYIRDGRKHIAR